MNTLSKSTTHYLEMTYLGPYAPPTNTRRELFVSPCFFEGRLCNLFCLSLVIRSTSLMVTALIKQKKWI